MPAAAKVICNITRNTPPPIHINFSQGGFWLQMMPKYYQNTPTTQLKMSSIVPLFRGRGGQCAGKISLVGECWLQIMPKYYPNNPTIQAKNFTKRPYLGAGGGGGGGGGRAGLIFTQLA